MCKWITNTVPNCKEKEFSDEVLVTVKKYSRETYQRVVKAIYVPYHHCTVEDVGWGMYDGIPNDWEYIEDEDTWWIPEGWYETCDYFSDYSYAEIRDKVVAWMPLPEPYKGE